MSESTFSDLWGKSKQNKEESIHTANNVKILMSPEFENKNEEHIKENDFLDLNVSNANRTVEFHDKRMASSSN